MASPLQATQPTPGEAAVKPPIVLVAFLKRQRMLFFRFGLGAIYLMNSAIAWLTTADEFRDALSTNKITAAIDHSDVFIKVIGINDGLLFLLILSGKFRKFAVVWGAAWICGVIFVTGVRTPDFILHLAVLGLLAFYALSDD